MQQLGELTDLLKPLELDSHVGQHILYPGHRRMQLVQALMSRLLAGKSLEALQLPADDSDDSLPPDERFAKKCQALLQMLGISATPDQLRGCSGQQERDMAPLLQIAKLLGVMEARRAASSRPSSRQLGPGQGAEDSGGQQPLAGSAEDSSRVTQLLAAAAGQLSKLLSETLQLFPTDLLDALKTYTDQGALAQLPQLCQHAIQRAQELQQTLHKLQKAGGSSCQGAGGEQWQRLVQDLDAALQRQLQEMQAFDTLYKQELTVWASDASAQKQQQQQLSHEQPQWGPAQGAAGSSWADSAEATGRMARSLMGGYQELQGLLEAVGTIMAQHSALQGVPAAVLQQQRDQHLQETYSLRMAASAVRPQRG